MPSAQRGARRPEQQLYIPGRGLLSKGSKSEIVPVAEKKSNLQSVSSKQVNSVCGEGFTGASNLKRHLKARRPDIQVYVPKAKLLASRVNELSHSSLNVLPQREKESQEVKALSSCCNSQNSPDVKILKIEDNSANNDKQCVDLPTQKSISWAEQVEEYLSNSIELNEELVEDSFHADRSKKGNLVINVDHLESVYSSGYSSSNEDLEFMRHKTSDFNEADSSHGILKQNLENSEFYSLVQHKHDTEEMVKPEGGMVKPEGGVCDEQIAFLEKLLACDKPIKIKKSLLAQILPCEAPLFPMRVEDEEKIRRREEILDRQMAFFDKLAAKSKSAKPKETVSVPVVPPEAPLFPRRENEDFLQMLEKREPLVEQQTFDKMLVKPESGRSQKTNVFQWLDMPKSSANPKIDKVPDEELSLNVPYTKLDHIFWAPKDLNSHHSPAALDTDLCTEVSLPFNMQCTKSEHTFCALEILNSCHSPVTLNADLYTEVSLPFNVSSTELDHSFCAPECSYSQGSLVSLDADLYIPPPLPLNRPRPKLDHNFPAPEYLKSYSLSLDDFYIPAPRPLT